MPERMYFIIAHLCEFGIGRIGALAFFSTLRSHVASEINVIVEQYMMYIKPSFFISNSPSLVESYLWRTTIKVRALQECMDFTAQNVSPFLVERYHDSLGGTFGQLDLQRGKSARKARMKLQ